jgi:hypothetical protein
MNNVSMTWFEVELGILLEDNTWNSMFKQVAVETAYEAYLMPSMKDLAKVHAQGKAREDLTREGRMEEVLYIFPLQISKVGK